MEKSRRRIHAIKRTNTSRGCIDILRYRPNERRFSHILTISSMGRMDKGENTTQISAAGSPINTFASHLVWVYRGNWLGIHNLSFCISTSSCCWECGTWNLIDGRTSGCASRSFPRFRSSQNSPHTRPQITESAQGRLTWFPMASRKLGSIPARLAPR